MSQFSEDSRPGLNGSRRAVGGVVAFVDCRTKAATAAQRLGITVSSGKSIARLEGAWASSCFIVPPAISV
jgi:hypothetical protein